MKNPLLLIPSSWAHFLGPHLLPLISSCFYQPTKRWNSLEWRGLHFQNPLGIAGGVDKNAKNMCDWMALGAGFVEIGTITPLPQGPNPGKILDRDLPSQSLWNKMGFPNEGADVVLKRVLQLKKNKVKCIAPLLVNIGKNRSTVLSEAYKDYVNLILKFENVADIFVINVSSPNTLNLRELQSQEYLVSLLKKVRKATRKPLLLKLSPNLSDQELKSSLDVAVQEDIDGFILTNTTTSRSEGSKFPQDGGVSGAPLRSTSEAFLTKSIEFLGEKRNGKLIISVGGVLEAADIQKRLQRGADLVEVYAALAFSGPFFFQRMANHFSKAKSVHN